MTETESPLRNRPASHPASAPAGKNVITIASGKGGVGKTVLATSLSHALANAGKKVLLFDGDVGLANVDIQLGLMPDMDLASVISGEKKLADVAFRYEAGGFDIIAGRSGSGSLGNLGGEQLRQIHQDLVKLGRVYDYVILDLGAGIDGVVQTLSAAAGPKLVVTNGEPTSLTDAYAFIKVTSQRQPNADTRILVNMVKSRKDGQKVYETLLTACRNFLKLEPALAGIVHLDERVGGAIRSQTGLLNRYPASTAAADIEDVAAQLIRGPA
ncbi:MinD/ParA family protein [Sneathiella chinensis]|uniref:Site-determining protein n=1 Tax=Sneathiella chinensis TaxID=349750 RepID=A0ABQ5U1Y2_9PROT|nr:MinD/ParA family protein [Sneathiella chinensis]GLQ05843.1 site-determining protein [Sneathiella chinensis]